MSPPLHFLAAVALLVVPTVADEPQRESAETDVALALAEILDTDSGIEDIQPTSGRETKEVGQWPGLLGHRYVEGRYLHITDKDASELFDDSLQGFDAVLNLPIPRVHEQTGFLGIDAFVSHRYLEFSGKHVFEPPGHIRPRPDDLVVKVEGDEKVTQFAASIYVDHERLGPVRPFIQLGMQFVAKNVWASIGGEIQEDNEDDVALLMAPGLEIGLWDFAALRATFDLFTEDVEESKFFGDVMLRPWNRVFLRGGIIAAFDGGEVGGSMGAGFDF